MKFLLVVSMLVGSVMANANVDNGWHIKCFERDGGDLDLAYIIGVHHQGNTLDRLLTLKDCTGNIDMATGNCQEMGQLKKYERQNQSCLVLKRNGVPGAEEANLDHPSWSLCYEQQETLENPRLVRVTVTADRQASRIYCERSILRVL